MARNKDFFVNNSSKRDRSFFVKEEKPVNTSISTKVPQVDTVKKTNIENRMSELDKLMKDTDTKLRRIGYTETERADFQNQYKTYKDEYYSLKKELDTMKIANTKVPTSDTNMPKAYFTNPVEQSVGDKVANFFKVTVPETIEDTWDNIKEPFTGQSLKQVMTEAKLSPKLLVEDAKIQMEKEDPTREDYALVKQTQEAIKKYGMPDSNIRAITEDTTKLQEQLKSAEKTWQVSPVDAAVANTGAAAVSIFGNLGSFANSIGADKVPLLKEVTNFAVDGARKAQENAQQYNRGSYGETLGAVTQGIVNLASYFVLGTGKVAVKGATSVSKYGKYIEPIIKNPSFWYSLTSMWGQKYQEKLDEGYNRIQALGNAIIYALPASLIEVSGGIGAQGKEAQSLLKTIGEEIAEEISQDIVSGISDKMVTDHDLPVFSTTEDAIVNPNELAKTALYTAPIAAFSGGANRVINKAISNRTSIQQNTQSTEAVQNDADVTQTKNENQQLALPSAKIYVDEQGNAMNTEQYSQLDVNPEAFRKRTALINDINKTLNLSNVEKADLLDTLNKAEFTAETEEGMRNILNVLDNPEAVEIPPASLENISNNFNQNKAKYAEYAKDIDKYDTKYVENAKDIVKTKNGKRTKEQWLQVAKALGSQIYEMNDADVEMYAYKSWIENRPNTKESLNRQGKGYVKFTMDEWVNTVYDTVRNSRNTVQSSNVEENNVLPTQIEEQQGQPIAYSPVNSKQRLEMRNIASDSNGRVQILPTQKVQETVRSAKLAGMTDVDIERATELNNAINSGAKLMFYDPDNISAILQGQDIDKAKIANGFYSNGTIWINKNSDKVVETILGHELTHHLESTNSYNDLANTIMDSDVFYSWLKSKGYKNLAEYKKSLSNNYAAEDIDYEVVANFVQEKLFTDQNTINSLAKTNRNVFDKIKQWIDDMLVKFSGTAEEKELRKIQNMYKKALEQAGENTKKSGVKYSFAGEVGLENLKARYEKMSVRQKEFVNELENNYQKAIYLSSKGYKNDQILKETGWFQSDGKWKWEIPDEYFKLKDDADLSNGEHRLSEIIDHDLIFMVYPELKNQKVKISNVSGRSLYNSVDKTIKLKIGEKSNSQIEASLLHEVQHAIQEIEGFDGGTSTLGGMLRYYEKPGEIEAADTVRRFINGKVDKTFSREYVAPELSKDNPKHPTLDKYLAGETQKQTPIRDNLYQKSKEKGNGIYEKIDRKALQMEIDKTYNGQNIRFDNGGRFRRHVNDTAGKAPAFSMPETDNQGRNQIKAVDNSSPTESVDIRYSMNPVEIAKNPPNPQSGLDPLQRMSREKEGNKQSSFTRNIYNQNIFDDTFKDLALDDKNIRTYESISNKETLQQANDAINEQGQKWVDRFLEKPNGEMKATDIAGGFILMNRYQQVGDYESMIRIAEKLRKAGTQQGQTIQMFSVLGRMTPEGMTYYAQTELNKAYDEILKNKTQAWADEHSDEFKLKERDIEFIQRRVNQASKLPEGRDKYVLLGEIAARIQSKIPPQAGQGLKALARNSMLLNPKTMVRNVLGNVVIAPSHITADFIGSGIDKAISKKTGVRTTGEFDVKSLKGVKKGVYESFDDFRRKISTREIGTDRFEIGRGGKSFYENHTGKFSAPRNALSKALNGLDRVTGYLLESGDRPFYETWFINSLNNQMKLNNVTEPTAEMIEIATDEALQRTWQDSNTYTKAVTAARDAMNRLNIKGYGLGDMAIPFMKTPANLTKSVIDFSPLGAINAAIKTSKFNKDIGKGVATSKQQREVVKAWSQVITGTLGMAIMTALANAGIISGGGDEDKDVRSFEQNILGIKPYSIKIGNKTYTYDWAQPLGTSAAMVTDTVKSLKNSKKSDVSGALLEGIESGASVLLEQSFVSGIRNLFEEGNFISALLELVLNEPAKFTPQFLSQLAQIQDDTARTSFVYNNKLATAQNKVKAKIPGLRQTLEPSVDVLGREVKTNNSVGNVMFNPANTAFARSTKAAEEMYSVYQETGDKATIAQVAPYYFNVNEEKIVLTPKQRTQYQKTTGKIASDSVENLLKNKQYMNLGASDKAEILKDLYAYGNAMAKKEVTEKYNLPTEYVKIEQSGMSPEEYILMKYISNLDGTKKDDMYNSLISAGYSQRKAENFLTEYKGYKYSTHGKDTLPTLSSKRSGLPTLNK